MAMMPARPMQNSGHCVLITMPETLPHTLSMLNDWYMQTTLTNCTQVGG